MGPPLVAALAVLLAAMALAPHRAARELGPTAWDRMTAWGDRLAGRSRSWSQKRVAIDEVGEVRRLASSVRSGVPVGRAIAELAGRGGPWAQPAARVAAEVARGRRLHDALDAWAQRSVSPGPALVAGAVALAEASGGATADALDAVGCSLAERAELHREVAAASSSARASTAVLVAIPLVFAALVAIADPRVGRVLVSTQLGLGCLVLALLLDLAGAAWMRRVVRQVAP